MEMKENKEKLSKKKKGFFLPGVILILILAFGLCACGADTNEGADLSAGSTFRFGGLEIRVGEQESIELLRVTNQQSEYFTKTVIRVPVELENLDGEPNSLLLAYYTFYDPEGNVLDDLSAEYMDYGEANWTGDLQPGETEEAFFYILYSEPGTYTIEFSKAGEEEKEVKIDMQDAGAESGQ